MLFRQKLRPKALEVASITLFDYMGQGARPVLAAELPTLTSFELQLNAYITDQFREYRLYTTKVISPDQLTRFQSFHGVFLSGYLVMQHLTHEALVSRMRELLAHTAQQTTVSSWQTLDRQLSGLLYPIFYSSHLLPDPAAPASYTQAAE
ncbi:hypothetical protein [Hymenobacter weizhouensis]|uniref:hypothetical protein n=1 Tax=Hymenobacter sp. YIM 151500-1 TaxID=2987689 RepID=UPI00222648F7|nr:hypothetical protein [Hymenobacter sp. YIM 151500-1]UYZ63962.1 hypothetical protein OIS53_03745 [Hymenobacter sp. YIM 151500-1]